MTTIQWMVRGSSRVLHGALIPLAVAFLASCGGGGGGGGGSDEISVVPAHLEFAGTANDTKEPSPQNITVTVSGSSDGYIATEFNGIAHENAPLQIDGRTATVSVRVPAPVFEGPGTHTGGVIINVYAYGFGGGHLPGSPIEVPVTYTIPGIAATDTPVFNQTAGSLPSPQTITISDAQSNSYAWATTVEYEQTQGWPEFKDWLQLTPSTGSVLPANVTFTVTTQGVAGREYVAYVTFTSVANPALSGRIPVTYRAQ